MRNCLVRPEEISSTRPLRQAPVPPPPFSTLLVPSGRIPGISSLSKAPRVPGPSTTYLSWFGTLTAPPPTAAAAFSTARRRRALAPVRREPAAAVACARQCSGGRGRGGEPRRPGSGRDLLGPSSALTASVFLPPRSPSLFACFDVLGLIFARFYDSGFHLLPRTFVGLLSSLSLQTTTEQD